MRGKVNYQFLPWTPEGKVERKIQADWEARGRDQENAWRREKEAEDRLDAPITRRELLAALEAVRLQAGANGTHDGDIIENAFQLLIDEVM